MPQCLILHEVLQRKRIRAMPQSKFTRCDFDRGHEHAYCSNARYWNDGSDKRRENNELFVEALLCKWIYGSLYITFLFSTSETYFLRENKWSWTEAYRGKLRLLSNIRFAFNFCRVAYVFIYYTRDWTDACKKIKLSSKTTVESHLRKAELPSSHSPHFPQELASCHKNTDHWRIFYHSVG